MATDEERRDETEEERDDQGIVDHSERTAGGVDPQTGEAGPPESSNADIPAA